ncbi:MAG: hypothetical protein J6Q61_01070 [Bacteroidales bacterium]|nr:hypothetical protein [Bacteroidales bacterium]
MANMEIILTDRKFGVKALDDCISAVAKIMRGETESSLHLCYILAQTAKVWENEATAPKDIPNITVFAKIAFGFEKSQTNACLNIGRRFVQKTKNGYRSIFVPDDRSYMDYSRSKLIKLVKYDTEDIERAIEEGVISPIMSCRAIEAAMSDFMNPPKESERSESESNGESNGEGEGSGTGEDTGTGEAAKEPAVKMVKLIVQSPDGEEVLNEMLIPMAAYDDLVRKYPQK